jgi:hypothetical protein
MKAMLENTCIPTEVMAELQEAAHKVARGVRDIEAAKKAAAQMDRLRDENRKTLGVQSSGVDIIRAMRDSR